MDNRAIIGNLYRNAHLKPGFVLSCESTYCFLSNNKKRYPMAIYIYVDGFEAKREGVATRADWFSLEAFTHGIGRGNSTSAASHSEISLTKMFDESSLELALAADSGRTFSQVIIDITRENFPSKALGGNHDTDWGAGDSWDDEPGSEEIGRWENEPSNSTGAALSEEPSKLTTEAVTEQTEEIILRYYLDNVFFSSYSISLSAMDLPVESFSISYKRLKWEYPAAKKRGFLFSATAATGSQDNEWGRDESPRSAVSSFEPNTAFLIMQIDPDNAHAEDVCSTVKRSFKEFGIEALRADDIQHDNKITDVVIDKINSSEFLFADITGERPNVYYEIGYAHSIGKFPMLFRHTGTSIHFDLSVHNVIEYKNMTELEALLSKRLSANRVGTPSQTE